MLALDHDNDGYPDLVVSTYREPVRLLRNMGDGTFRDLTPTAALPPGERWWTSVTALDHDRDGWLDLYIGSYVQFGDADWVEDPELVPYDFGVLPSTMVPGPFRPTGNVLMRNRGDGSFEDQSSALGVEDLNGRGLGALAADLDEDGWTDLFVANDVSPCALFRNAGGRFEDIGSAAWVDQSRGSMGIAMADYDRDGDQDIVVTHWVGDIPALYTSTLSKTRRLAFQDAAEARGLGLAPRQLVGWAVAFVDLGLDGIDDLVIVNGHTNHGSIPGKLAPQASLVFRGEGTGFRMRPNRSDGVDALDRAIVGRGMALTDLENDGREDLAVGVNNGPGLIWAQVAPAGSWLGLILVGTASNRDALGSRVRFESGSVPRVKEIVSGDSYLSSNARRVLFGLGRAGAPDVIEVTWSSGGRESFPVPGVDRYLRLVEGTGRSPIADRSTGP